MNTPTHSHRVAIVTRYLPPTNNRGSRIRVHRADSTYRDDAHAITGQWSYADGVADNHAAAVAAYLAGQDAAGNDWTNGGSWTLAAMTTGYVAVWTPNPDA